MGTKLPGVSIGRGFRALKGLRTVSMVQRGQKCKTLHSPEDEKKEEKKKRAMVQLFFFLFCFHPSFWVTLDVYRGKGVDMDIAADDAASRCQTRQQCS